MLDSVINYVGSLNAGEFYIALFICAYVENIFPPVPGDTVTVFAAYLVGRLQRGILGVFVATSLGSAAGFMTYYALGRLIHPEYFERKNYRFLPATTIRNAGEWFQRYGYWVVLFNRFLSGIRSAVSIICGMYRLPWPLVLLLCAVGCSIWNALLLWAGYQLGSNWRQIEQIMRHYSRAVFAVIAVLALAWIVRSRVLASRSRR